MVGSAKLTVGVTIGELRKLGVVHSYDGVVVMVAVVILFLCFLIFQPYASAVTFLILGSISPWAFRGTSSSSTMEKPWHSCLPPWKSSSSTLILTVLLMFTFAALSLLALGILLGEGAYLDHEVCLSPLKRSHWSKFLKHISYYCIFSVGKGGVWVPDHETCQA